MGVRIITCMASTILLASLIGCGGGASNTKPPDKVITKDDAINQVEADLKRNLEEVDKDPNMTPKQKEETKAMMRENVKKRMDSMKSQ